MATDDIPHVGDTEEGSDFLFANRTEESIGAEVFFGFLENVL